MSLSAVTEPGTAEPQQDGAIQRVIGVSVTACILFIVAVVAIVMYASKGR